MKLSTMKSSTEYSAKLGPSDEQFVVLLAALARRRVRQRRSVAHGDQIVAADEHVCFAELDLGRDDLRGVQRDEQRIVVQLDLRPLMRVVRVLDGKVVQAEFLLQFVQQGFVGLVQADPDECILGPRQSLISSSVMSRSLRPSVRIGDAVDQHRLIGAATVSIIHDSTAGSRHAIRRIMPERRARNAARRRRSRRTD